MYRRAVLHGERAEDPKVARVVVAVGREYRRSGVLLGAGVVILVMLVVSARALSIPLAPVGVVSIVLLITFAIYLAMWFKFGTAIRRNEEPR